MTDVAPSFYVEDFEVPAEAFTFEGFRKWYGRREGMGPKVSWIGGRIYVELFVLTSCRGHAPAARAINLALTTLALQLDVGHYLLPPIRIADARSGFVTEPDGSFVRWSSFTSGRVRVNPDQETELLGAPDMALEVVSKSSVGKDQVDLLATYAVAGVEEYWLADARRDIPALRILVLRDGAYVDVAPDADGWLASPLWGRSFRLIAFKNRAGLDDARLEQRPAPTRARHGDGGASGE